MSLPVAEQESAALIHLTSDLRWTVDAALRFDFVIGPLVASGELPAQQLLGRQLADWPAPRIRNARAFGLLAQRAPFRDMQIGVACADARLVWLSLCGLPRHDEAGRFQGYVGIAQDITRRIEDEAHYRHLAQHDALTGLPNRRLLSDRLLQALLLARRQGSRLALLMIDLDEFKAVNDHQGHAAGDRLLIELAGLMRQAVRQSDTVARLGGDEFAVLLPRVAHSSDALAVAGKLLDALAASDKRLCASIGVALFPDHAQDEPSLLMQADRAMYLAKNQGGARIALARAIQIG